MEAGTTGSNTAKRTKRSLSLEVIGGLREKSFGGKMKIKSIFECVEEEREESNIWY